MSFQFLFVRTKFKQYLSSSLADHNHILHLKFPSFLSINGYAYVVYTYVTD